MRQLKKRLGAALLSALFLFPLTGLPHLSLLARPVEAVEGYQQAFIQSISGAAVTIAHQHGLFPSIMIAQAILESDWGRSKLSQAPYYNLFGIKGGSDGIVFDTLEDDGTGNYYAIRDSFRRYNSVMESLADYARLFRSTPYLTRVYANFVNSPTVEAATQALTGTYATDTRYGKKLMNIIIGYNLLIYDGQVNRGPSWSIEAKNDIVYSQFDQVNIRSDHSTDSKVIGRAQTGQSFKRLGVTTGWTLIDIPGYGQAYIASEYVSTTKPAEDPLESGLSLDPEIAELERLLKESRQHPTASDAALPPPEPEAPAEPQGPSEEEIEKARQEADKAIAEGPSQAAKDGLLDSRTAGVANETPVDKSQLETYLGSNVDLPFTSEEVKKEYKSVLQKAANLYWNGKAKQEEIDAVVKSLADLQEKAQKEDQDGFKADQEQLREVRSEKTGVSMAYTKQSVEKAPNLQVETTTKLEMGERAKTILRDRGQRWLAYEVQLKDEEGARQQPSDKVELRVPIPKQFEGKSVELYERKENGTLLKLNLSPHNGQFYILTKKPGVYIVVERNMRLEQARQKNEVAAAGDGVAVSMVSRPSVRHLYGAELLALISLYIAYTAIRTGLRRRKKGMD